MRGAGTSIAGNAVGPGIVVDTSKHLNRVLAVDPEAGTADVQPGVVHAALQRAATPYGLRFGPDPSTHTRCTIGGMVGNNACGSRALGYGRTSDNVVALDVVTGTGERLRTDGPAGTTQQRLADLVDAHLATVRTELGRFGRQVSGYSLEHLLPENGRDLGALPGRQRGHARRRARRDRAAGAATRPCASSRCWATRRCSRPPTPSPACCTTRSSRARAWTPGSSTSCGPVAARFPTCRAGPAGCSRRSPATTEAEVVAAARAVIADAGALDSRVVVDAAEAAALWRIREDGAGLAAVSLDRPAHAGWEDAAVPPERLGGYLRDFDALLRESAPRRRALRPLRRRLRARADRLRAARRRRPRPVPGVPRRRRAAGGVVRRHPLRRARRRPGPLGAAAADVLRRGARPVRPGQGGARPRRRAQPRGARRAATRRRRPPARRPRCTSPRARSAGPTTPARSSTRCTAAPASASAWPHRPAG